MSIACLPSCEESACDRYSSNLSSCMNDYCSGKDCLHCECYRQGKIDQGGTCVVPEDEDPMTEAECKEANGNFEAVCDSIVLALSTTTDCGP